MADGSVEAIGAEGEGDRGSGEVDDDIGRGGGIVDVEAVGESRHHNDTVEGEAVLRGDGDEGERLHPGESAGGGEDGDGGQEKVKGNRRRGRNVILSPGTRHHNRASQKARRGHGGGRGRISGRFDNTCPSSV